MKKCSFLSTFLLVITLIGCDNKTNSVPPAGINPGLNFTCLRCPIASVKNFLDTSQQYNNLVFNFYYSSGSNALQMIGYGEYLAKDTTRYRPLSSTPFPIFDSAKTNYTDLALGNLSISIDTITQIITYAPGMGGNMLLFVPDIEQSNFVHPTYRMYLTNFDSTAKKPVNTIIPLNSLFGTEGVNLNPCPPAHNIDY